jgi:hypothetical protein
MFAWLERQPLLRNAADLWIISDPVTHADAAVVLGGGLDDRPFAAAELYHKGLVNKVLVSQVEEDRAAMIGAIQGHTESNRQVLLKLGVPIAAIETFGKENKTTKDEALALRKWTDNHAVSAVIIPIEIFNTRRLRWIFRHEFVGKNVRIEIESIEPSRYSRSAWWKTSEGVISFQNEFLKYVYYRLIY